ncbi:LysR substrate-binding domain-containing protein, partial [Paraburkholderia sp. EG286B]|uniref:LysR substrate-binding domain-containing protein n=1 Tax=Paraburkholderia sp. EG286B TaxID=3237011 RepID=UPI0034D294CB
RRTPIPEFPETVRLQAKRLFTFLRKPCSTSTEIRVRLRRNTHFELPPSPFQVNVAEAMALALRDGRGIGALPLWTAMPWLRNGTLLRVLPTHRMNETHIRALYVSREYLDAKIRSWVDFLRDFIPQTLDDGDNVPPAAVLTDADLTM